MSHKIVLLVQRLAAPAVAVGLAKEELCLALAAAGQLRPFSSSTVTTAATSATPSNGEVPEASSNAVSSSTPATEPLARRSLRLISQCSPQELRMVASGASALQWPRTAPSSSYVVEALVQGLYKHLVAQHASTTTAQRKSIRSARVRLADVMAVVRHAMDAGHFFNPTLHAILSEELVVLMRDSPGFTSAAAEELMAVVCAYLGEQDGLAVLQQVQVAAAASAGAASLEKCVAGQPLPVSPAWAAAYSTWTRQRDALLSSLASPESEENAVDPAVLRQQKARHDVLTLIQRLRRGDAATAVQEEAIVSALDAVRVFQLHDPVTLGTLDSALLARLTAAASAPVMPATVAAMENAVYAQAQRFPQTLAMLRARDEKGLDSAAATTAATAPEALQHISTIQRVYQKARDGAALSDKDLFLVGNDINEYSADEIAKAVCVFACVRDIPTNLIMLLANNTVTALSTEGVVALLRAARHDRAGALRTVVTACLSDVATLQRSLAGAAAETLTELAVVLAQPHTRWHTTTPDTVLLEAQVRELAVAQLLLQVTSMPWAALLGVVRGIGRLPAGQEDLIRAACDRLTELVSTAAPSTSSSAEGQNAASLSLTQCLDLVEALQEGDVVNEQLLDVLAATLGGYFIDLAAGTAEGDAERLAALLRFVTLQRSYEAPELAEVAGDVVRTVAHTRSWSALPAELLAAAALASLDRSNVSSLYSFALALPHRVLAHFAQERRLSTRLSLPLAAAVVNVVFALPSAEVDETAVAYCVEAVAPVAAALPPVTAVRLVCVAHRRTSTASAAAGAVAALPPEVYTAVAAHVRGLPAADFTALCCAAASPSLDEALTNQLIEALPLLADRLSPQQLSRCVYGLGEMRHAGQRLSHQVATEALSDYVVDNVELFTSGRDIAALLHGFAKLQCTKRNLYSVFAKQVYRRCVRYTLDFKSISFLFFAFGCVKFVDQKLMSFLCQVFGDYAEQLAAPDLLLTLRGASRMCLLNSHLYWRLGDMVVQRAGEFPLVAQCELLHAYGFLEQRHPKLSEELATRVAAQAAALPSASAAIDVLVSLWMMDWKVSGAEPTAALAAHILEHSSELTNQDMTKLCALMIEAGWSHPPLLHAIVAHSLELKAKDQLEAGVARVVLDALGMNHFFDAAARTELSKLARSVSKEVVQLSGEEQEQLNLLTTR